MEIQELEVFISPEGKISFEVRGVPGRKCLDLTKGLEMDLGGDILAREETSEMSREQVIATIAQKQQTRS